MANPYRNTLKKHKNNKGFSLIEMMVVMVIIAILAVGVVFMFADPTAKVKAAAFELRGDLNLARAAAVKDKKDVRIDFDPATGSYRIWQDDWHEGNSAAGLPPQDGIFTTDQDTLVKNVSFQNKVEYYGFDGAPPANGPAKDPLNNDLGAGNDGITLSSTTLTLSPDGTCDTNGSIVVYYPERDDFDTLRADPYAVVIDSTATGRIVLQRWRREQGAWVKK